MKRFRNILGGVLGLVGLGVLVVVLVFSALRDKQTPAVSYSPLQSPTPTKQTTAAVSPTAMPPEKNEPSPTITPVDETFRSPLPTPTMTNPPKPTKAPTSTPTITPVPTALPLPVSDFYALWVENFSGINGESCCKGSILWMSDPRDVAKRQEVLRFEREIITEAALSPDNQTIALATSIWPGYALWLANSDGTGLRQINVGADVIGVSGLFWSRDSRFLIGNITWQVFGTEQDAQTGKSVPTHWAEGATYLVNVMTGEQEVIQGTKPNEPLRIMGWSPDGKHLYSAHLVSQGATRSYEVWSTEIKNMEPQKAVSLESDLDLLRLSSDGSRLLYAAKTLDGLTYRWASVDGQVHQDILTLSWKQQCGIIWSPKVTKVVLCLVDDKEPVQHIKILDLDTREEELFGPFEILPASAPFSPLALSPDLQWLVYDQGDTGIHWTHLPSGVLVSVSQHATWHVFVDWIPRAQVYGWKGQGQ